MAFNVKVDGQTVHEVDIDPRLVVGVSLRTAAGEAGVAGSPFTGEGNDWVNIVLTTQQPTALPVAEDDARLAASEDGPNEVLTYNENAQREEALKKVNEEFAEKSAESDEDLTAERLEAETAAMDPETREAPPEGGTTVGEVDEEEADTESEDMSL